MQNEPTEKILFSAMIPMEKSGNDDFEKGKTNPLKPMVTSWPAMENTVNTGIPQVFWGLASFFSTEIQVNPSESKPVQPKFYVIQPDLRSL